MFLTSLAHMMDRVFDPSQLPLTILFRDYVSGTTGTWTCQTSAGPSSASSSLGPMPGVSTICPNQGTALNHHGVASFNQAATTGNSMQQTGTMANFIQPKSVSGWILINPAEIAKVQYLWMDDGVAGSGFFSTGIRASGNFRVVLNGTVIAEIGPLRLNQWQLCTFRYDGAFCQVGINCPPGFSGSVSASVPFTNVINSLSTSNVRLGRTSAAPGSFFTGSVAELGVSNQILTDQNYWDLIGYCNQRYALSLRMGV